MKALPIVLAFGLMCGSAFAASNTWSEQWYKAKFGHPSPAEQARLKAEAANSAFRDAGLSQPQSWKSIGQAVQEQQFRVKYGRPAPSEEARRKADSANTAYRDVPSKPLRDGWTREIFRTKYGLDPGVRK